MAAVYVDNLPIMRRAHRHRSNAAARLDVDAQGWNAREMLQSEVAQPKRKLVLMLTALPQAVLRSESQGHLDGMWDGIQA